MQISIEKTIFTNCQKSRPLTYYKEYNKPNPNNLPEKIIEKEDIKDVFSYDFNNDKKIDIVKLVIRKTDYFLDFYANNNGKNELIFETKVPSEHVFIEKKKYKNDKELPISLVEKNQTIIAYISYINPNEFKVSQVCHILNEVTPIGYKEKENCKKIELKISELTFNKALNVLD